MQTKLQNLYTDGTSKPTRAKINTASYLFYCLYGESDTKSSGFHCLHSHHHTKLAYYVHMYEADVSVCVIFSHHLSLLGWMTVSFTTAENKYYVDMKYILRSYCDLKTCKILCYHDHDDKDCMQVLTWHLWIMFPSCRFRWWQLYDKIPKAINIKLCKISHASTRQMIQTFKYSICNSWNQSNVYKFLVS